MNFRKTAPIIVIVMGLIISILILTSTGKESEQEILVASPDEESDARFDFDSENTSGSLLKNIGGNKNNSPEDSSYNENLTDYFAEEYSRKVFERSGNFQNAESLEPLSQEEIDRIEKDLVNKIEKIFEANSFTEEDIIISNDDSIENQVAYLKAIGKVSSGNFGNFDKGIFEIVEEWMASGGITTSDLRKYSDIAAGQIDGLLKIEAPLLWKDFHLKNLNFWERKKQLAEALLRTEKDALKSMIAFQKMPELAEDNQSVGESFASSYQKLMKKYNKQ